MIVIRPLIRILPILYLLCFFQSVLASTQQAPALQLTQLLNHFSTIKAQFKQEATDAQHQVLQKSSGSMMLMRPGRFRWETEKPMHQIVITDGNTLWIYDADLMQATKQSIRNAPINPAKLLSGDIADLFKQFDVSIISHRADQLVFKLIPKKPNQAFHAVNIIFKHHHLYGMEIQNNLAQVNSFVFSHVVMNKRLSLSLFRFSAPAGVDVMQ